jgi:2-phosphosulfolactate phosphatase
MCGTKTRSGGSFPPLFLLRLDRYNPNAMAIPKSQLFRPLIVDVVFLPSELRQLHLAESTVVVFDVLRATTSITAALAANVSEIRIFGSVEGAVEAASHFEKSKLLCGEVDCLPPPGFDLGNSPTAFVRKLHGDHVAFLSTSNGTKAIIAAQEAQRILIGALVNAQAVAEVACKIRSPVTLLCAGTNGRHAIEDVLGAGAVAYFLKAMSEVELSDAALIAMTLFEHAWETLSTTMRLGRGGQNLINAGLEADIDFCAGLNTIPLVGRIYLHPLRVSLDREPDPPS